MWLFVCVIGMFILVAVLGGRSLEKDALRLVNERRDTTKEDLIKIERAINCMDGIPFEYFCAELFRRNGYKAIVTPSSGDMGRDIELYKDGKKIFVECKCYRDSQVSSPMINKIIGSATVFGADEIIFVTTSRYSKSALQLIEMSPIPIHRYYTDDLLEMCKGKTREIIRLLYA